MCRKGVAQFRLPPALPLLLTTRRTHKGALRMVILRGAPAEALNRVTGGRTLPRCRIWRSQKFGVYCNNCMVSIKWSKWSSSLWQAARPILKLKTNSRNLEMMYDSLVSPNVDVSVHASPLPHGPLVHDSVDLCACAGCKLQERTSVDSSLPTQRPPNPTPFHNYVFPRYLMWCVQNTCRTL